MMSFSTTAGKLGEFMLTTILANIAAVFLSAFLVTTLAVPLVIRFAEYFRIVDIPGSRRIHSDTIPRAGGIAVFLGTHVGAAAVLLLHGGGEGLDGAFNVEQWWILLLASTLMTLVGFIDDLQNLKPLTKLAGQASAALILMSSGVRIESMFGFDLPMSVSLVMTMLWFLFITNTFNLIDGLDGLATGLAGIASLGLAGSLVYRQMFPEALVLVGFIGALLGFFRYNRYPAKVFLGDSGSNFIGFMLATISLQTGSKSSAFAYVAVGFLAFSVPMFDTFLAVWRRSNRLALAYIISGKSPGGVMSSDLEHLHHRLLNRGLSQRDVVAFLHFANAILVMIGLITLPYQQEAFGILLLTFLLGLFVVIRYVPLIELKDTGLAIIHAVTYPTSAVLIFFVRMCCDGLIIAVSLTAAVSILSSTLFLGWIYSFLSWGVFPWMCITLGEFICFRERMPGIMRLRFLSNCFLLGAVISYAYVLARHSDIPVEISVQTGIFSLLAYAGLIGARIFRVTLNDKIDDRAGQESGV